MLTVDFQSVDLGYIKFGNPTKFEYTITNNSDKDILINKIAVGCSSCTVAKVSNFRVKPNIPETISVNFTPGTLGKQKKHIDVLYEDKTLRLEFNAVSHE